MGKHAYMIMAHDDWDLLNNLIRCIDDTRNDIYLHIDKKSDFRLSYIVQPKHSSLVLIDRTNIVWGGDSQIKCELKLMKAAYPGNYQYYHLLSGRDLPLKTQDEIHDFFERNNGHNYLIINSSAESMGFVETRIKEYHLFQNKIGRNDSLSANIYRRLEQISLGIQRKLSINRLNNEMIYYKGGNWFSITHDMVKMVLAEDRRIRKMFFGSVCADEIFLQTIAMNSTLAASVVNDNLRNIDWNRGNPYIWRMEDLELLINDSHLFARKFSTDVNEDIILKIVKQIKPRDTEE